MNRDELLAQLLAEQMENGAFRSVVHWPERQDINANIFATAQVLRSLSLAKEQYDFTQSNQHFALVQAQERALAYIRQGESVERPGYFAFWPALSRPSWIPALSEDTDDTAIVCLELAKYEQVEKAYVRRIVYKVLIPHRVQRVEQPAPPWLRRGVYHTWLRSDHRSNIIDCCVNANVLALMAYAELQHLPGYQEACAMIEDGILWAGPSRMRAQCLMPFYPDPVELRYAIEYAIHCGAVDLTRSLKLLKELPWATTAINEEGFICGSAYGHIAWTSRAVQIARKFHKGENALSSAIELN